MKATEANQLRIGNYLQRLDDSIFQVTAQDILTISEWGKNDQLLPKFIPLSEEVLMRLGFECSYKSNMHSVYSLGDGAISYYFWYGTGNSYLSIVGTKFICNTVHHLQNIVHDLLGHQPELKK
jgi:hypothetical protein